MSFYGQITTITVDPIESLAQSPSLVGLGLSMEAQQGNEIVHDLLLDQAWSETPIETEPYFKRWNMRLYSSAGKEGVESMAAVWEQMRMHFYDNKNTTIKSVPKSIFELSPSIEGLLGRTGNQPTTYPYDLGNMAQVFGSMHRAGMEDFSLWDDPAFNYDMIDASRQILSGLFEADYVELITTWKTEPRNETLLANAGDRLISRLSSLDRVMSAQDATSLSTWIYAARFQTYNSTLQDIFEYNARLQITGWGPDGEKNDYASKAWGGLIRTYYIPRWQIFIAYLAEMEVAKYNEEALKDRLREFEVKWQHQKLRDEKPVAASEALLSILTVKFADQVNQDWMRTKALAKRQKWD